MSSDPEINPRTLIGPRTAIILYLLLVAFACWQLHGKALALALIIIGGLAAKSFLHYWRARVEH